MERRSEVLQGFWYLSHGPHEHGTQEHPSFKAEDLRLLGPALGWGRGSGLRFTVYGLRFTVYGLRFTVYGLRFTVYGLRFTVYVYE